MSEQTKLDQLGVRVEGIASQQHQIGKDVQKLAKSLTTAMTALKTLQSAASGSSESDEVTSEWLTMTDPVEAADVLVKTWTWVRDVWRHHHPELAPCWPLHPRVVEDLRAMQATWDAARKAPAAPALMTGWLVQARPPIVEGIKSAMGSCNDGQHKTKSTIGRAVKFTLGSPPELTLMDVAEWWTAYHDEAMVAPGLVEVTR